MKFISLINNDNINMNKITDYKLSTSKEQLTKSFRIIDLKQFLKECKLKISGKKCILEADSDGIAFRNW